MSEDVFLGAKNIGKIGEKKIYVTYKTQEHYFRMFQGFALSTGVMNLLKDRKIELIQIVYTGKKKIKYLSTINQWENSMNEWLNKIDGQDDPQKVLAVKDMLILSEEEIKDGS